MNIIFFTNKYIIIINIVIFTITKLIIWDEEKGNGEKSGRKLDETNLQTVGNWRKIINCDKIYIKAKNGAKKEFQALSILSQQFWY